MKESEQVGEVYPKSTIQATSIETAIHERIMPLHHHESLTFQAVHPPTFVPSSCFPNVSAPLGPIRTPSLCLTETIEDEGEAAGQQPTPEDRGAKGKDCA
mgnify:CR=1 FL=1